MARRDRFALGALFIAIPELRFDLGFLGRLLESRFISDEERAFVAQLESEARRASKTVRKMRGKSVLERLVIVAPEILSVTTVNILRQTNLISVEEAQKARVLARALAAALPNASRPTTTQLLGRMFGAAGSVVSTDAIDILRRVSDQDYENLKASILRGNVIPGQERRLTKAEKEYLAEFRAQSDALIAAGRQVVAAKGIIARSIIAAKGADSVLQAVFLILPEVISERVLRGAVALGVMSPRQAIILREIIAYGPVAWRAGLAAKRGTGFEQRVLMGMYGALTQELLDSLAGAGWITPEQRRLLQPAVTIARDVLRQAVDNRLPARKYRVLPGENPINTFARTQRGSDRAVLQLLAEAARDATREAEKLAALGKRGANIRSKQYQIAAAELHKTMRLMWEDVGHIIIRGEREVALAAIEAMQELEKTLYKGNGKRIRDVDTALRAQGRAGVDSFISSKENMRNLSSRVYKNRLLYEGVLDKRIALNLLQGKSAKEFADTIRKFVDPKTPGGVSYAANRLARTEINNAFHTTSIRYTREQPWVTGYKWHLSGSHPKPDICNEYAERDHHGRGPGIFTKGTVPGKPHPHCFCYITPEVMDERDFLRAAAQGRFKQYWNAADRAAR